MTAMLLSSCHVVLVNNGCCCCCCCAFIHVQVRKNRYVILPKDFEKGYKANVKKSGDEFAFYQ